MEDLDATLIDLETRSWEAWKARDASYFESFLSDDHVEVGFTGVTDKKTVLASVATSNCAVHSYSVSDFRAHRLTPDVALLTYRAAQDTTCGSWKVPSPVVVSSLYVRRNGRWQNFAYQQTQDIRP